jgi:prepilin-type N-terminal cleavage/methylation domain-containing protein
LHQETTVKPKLKQSSGFTILEMLSVFAIVAVLAAITYPALTASMLSAKVTSAGQRLRQIHLITMLYQADEEAQAEYGNPEEMGLPWDIDRAIGYAPHDAISITSKLLEQVEPDRLRRSPCGFNPTAQAQEGIHYMPRLAPEWRWGSKELGQNVVLWVDPNCNPLSTDLRNQFSDVRALGITLAGQLLDRRNDHEYYFSQLFFNNRTKL